MRILSYLLAGIFLALVVVAILPRRICLLVGGLLLLLGVVLPVGVWGYSALFVRGDPSAYGMLGTICVILFAPVGIVLMLLALAKKE